MSTNLCNVSCLCLSDSYQGRKSSGLRACREKAGSRPYASAGRTARGLTLIELLITLAILGILAAALLPQMASDVPDRLSAGAQIVASDIDYARSLAVANNSTYRFTFEPAFNRYVLQHSGSDARLHTLPRSAFRSNSEALTRQTTDLSTLPLPAPGVRLAAVAQMEPSAVSKSELEFTPLGNTTSAYETVLWLGSGSGAYQRFVPISVNPVTGLTSIGPMQTALPGAIAALASQQQ